MTRIFALGLCLFLAGPALADDDDDFLDDILAPDTKEGNSTKEERVGLEQDANDEMTAEAEPAPIERKKTIKTLQHKTFL